MAAKPKPFDDLREPAKNVARDPSQAGTGNGGQLKTRVISLLGRYPDLAVQVLRGWINETSA